MSNYNLLNDNHGLFEDEDIDEYIEHDISDDIQHDISDEEKALHNYHISNTANYGKILIKRYISSSFLGLGTKIWKLKQFRFIGPYFEFWRIGEHDNAKKINLNNCYCSKMYSSLENIPVDTNNFETSLRYVFTFKIYKSSKKILHFASLRLDSIEQLYYKFYRLFNK